jgi:hypothetical protein
MVFVFNAFKDIISPPMVIVLVALLDVFIVWIKPTVCLVKEDISNR